MSHRTLIISVVESKLNAGVVYESAYYANRERVCQPSQKNVLISLREMIASRGA